MKKFLPQSTNLIDGNLGTCRHLKEVLEAKDELSKEDELGKIEIYNSSDDKKYMELSNKLLTR